MANEDIFIKMVLDAWHIHVKRTDDLLDVLSDDQLAQEIAPGRNRGIYLLGHLTAVHDRMLPTLELGTSLYPELWKPFVESADKEATNIPDMQTLWGYWKQVNHKLAVGFASFTPKDWFQKHTSISSEDFEKEPHRNRLNLIINRTNHLADHLGQLLLLKPRA